MAEEKKEEVKVEAVIDKANKGEKLTKEEEVALLKSEGAPEGYTNVTTEVVEEPPKEEKKEEAKPEEKPKAKEEASKEPPKEDKKDFFLRLEQELAKPEGQEDLKDFTDREKAYFHSMRRDRKARQKAEEERDQARFREIQLKQKAKEEKPVEEPDPVEELKKKDPTDFLTVDDALKLLERQAKKKEEPPKAEEPLKKDPVRMKYLELCDKEARASHQDDYDYVMELTAEIVDTNPDYQKRIAQALLEGKNPAEEMYSIIKSDPEFAKLYPVAQTRVDARKAKKPEGEGEKPKEKSPEELKKEQEAEAAQKALEANAAKPKTTGHASASEEKPLGELTMEDIIKMSDREFAMLPKKVRDAYLRKYG